MTATGGFSVIETDNPESVGEAAAKFNPYFRFEIIPVNDIGETTRLLSEGVEFRKSILEQFPGHLGDATEAPAEPGHDEAPSRGDQNEGFVFRVVTGKQVRGE